MTVMRWMACCLVSILRRTSGLIFLIGGSARRNGASVIVSIVIVGTARRAITLWTSSHR